MIDNYDLWEANDRKQAHRIAHLPVCDFCGEAIQQEKALKIMGLWICDECINNNMEWIEED